MESTDGEDKEDDEDESNMAAMNLMKYRKTMPKYILLCFLKVLDNYYFKKPQKISIEVEAAIELLSMLRQSNASLLLYTKNSEID